MENEQVWGKRGGGGYYEDSFGQVEIKEFLRNPNGNVDISRLKKKKKGFAKRYKLGNYWYVEGLNRMTYRGEHKKEIPRIESHRNLALMAN